MSVATCPHGLVPWHAIMTGLLAYECSIPQNCNTNILRVIMDLDSRQNYYQPAVTTKLTLPLGFTSPAVECGIFAMALHGHCSSTSHEKCRWWL